MTETDEELQARLASEREVAELYEQAALRAAEHQMKYPNSGVLAHAVGLVSEAVPILSDMSPDEVRRSVRRAKAIYRIAVVLFVVGGALAIVCPIALYKLFTYQCP